MVNVRPSLNRARDASERAEPAGTAILVQQRRAVTDGPSWRSSSTADSDAAVGDPTTGPVDKGGVASPGHRVASAPGPSSRAARLPRLTRPYVFSVDETGTRPRLMFHL